MNPETKYKAKPNAIYYVATRDFIHFSEVSLFIDNQSAGESGKAVISLSGKNFQYYDESIDEVSTFSGKYQLLYGSSSADKDLQSLDFEVL